MTDSVRERILKNIVTTLESVTVDNGYRNTLRSVQRFLQPGQTTADVPTVIVLEGEDDSDDGPSAGSYDLLSRTMNVGILIVHRQDVDIDARSASETMNSLIADIQKCMQVDIGRGNHAVNTNERSISPIEVEPGQPDLSSVIVYSIQYRHRRTDPTIAG